MKNRWAIFVSVVLVGIGLCVGALLTTRPSTVLAQGAPDLVIENLVFSSANPDPGQAITLTATIKNIGAGSADGFYVRMYIDPPFTSAFTPTAETPYIAQTFFGLPLNPGASFHWSRTGHSFAMTGTHQVYVWVDPIRTVPEMDEANNLFGPALIQVGALPAQPDGYEPDDTCPQAKPILTDGSEQAHTLSPTGDADWAKFAALSGVAYRIQAVPVGADADVQIEVRIAGRNGNCPPSLGSAGNDIEFVAPNSTSYYIRASHTQPAHGPSTAYVLKVTALNLCNGDYEPNNVCSVAGDLEVNGAPQHHSFCQPGDADWVQMPVGAGVTYVITSANAGPNTDAQFSAFGSCSAAAPFGTGSAITFTAATTGHVYAKVMNRLATHGLGSAYTLGAQAISQGCAADAFEPDNSSAQAQLLAVDGATQSHLACPAGDVDWVKLEATAGVTYTIETLNLARQADTVLCLFDSTGQQALVCDDDGGAGLGSRLIWRAATTGALFLQVRHASAGTAGPDTRYDIRATTRACQADALEPDNDRGSARPIRVSEAAQTHNICGAQDQDWHLLTISEGQAGQYGVQTFGLGAEADTVVELYDVNGIKLAANDDYTLGASSQLTYTFNRAGNYYVRARHYNANRHGSGTEYEIAVKAIQIFTPTPTPTPTTTPTATPTASPTATLTSTIKTLILVHPARIAARYGASDAEVLMSRLDQLAANVNGEVVRLDQNTTVQQRYQAWDTHPISVTQINQVTSAIRALIMSYWQQHAGLEYIVLVGNDDMLPLRRIPDFTDLSGAEERDYMMLGGNTVLSASLRANFYLSDDYYADQTPSSANGRELYIPDLALGRLIETPRDMVALIDHFLAHPVTQVSDALVTGYRETQDVGEKNCAIWREGLGLTQVNCALVSQTDETVWTAADLLGAHTSLSPAYQVQSINGHAFHTAEVPATGAMLFATNLLAAAQDFRGHLIYTPGCHAGLNVPGGNAADATLDLAEVFARKGANYVGNTGFGYAYPRSVAFSELLMQLYTEELLREGTTKMGKALSAAKLSYVQSRPQLKSFDEKVMQELVFYGLPMTALRTRATFDTQNPRPFRSVRILQSPPAFGESVSVTVQLLSPLRASEAMSKVITQDGAYFAVDNSITMLAGEPAQPVVFGDLDKSSEVARSVVISRAVFDGVSNIDPLVVAPVSDFITQTAEPRLSLLPQWQPALPISLQTQNGRSSVVAQLGQYQAASKQQRLFHHILADVFSSNSPDVRPPQAILADGVLDADSGIVSVKVDATDDTRIQLVRVTYGVASGAGIWQSIDLQFDAAAHKWIGTFAGRADTRFFIQIVDEAGNMTAMTNKGNYFAPAVDTLSTSVIQSTVFLPLISR